MIHTSVQISLTVCAGTAGQALPCICQNGMQGRGKMYGIDIDRLPMPIYLTRLHHRHIITRVELSFFLFLSFPFIPLHLLSF
ncbi:hypothetical protein B0H13DRAFT_2065044, partial [Mycena leptocephala]